MADERQREWERYLWRAGAGDRAMRAVFDEIARALHLEAIVRWLARVIEAVERRVGR